MQYPSFLSLPLLFGAAASRLALRRTGGIALLSLAALLAGCATGYKLENDVQAFSGLQAVPANLRYRFERLPSQTVDPATQQRIEALADPALFQVGFRRDDAAPVYGVTVTARGQRILSPWADPWYGGWGPWYGAGWNAGIGIGGRRGSLGIGFGAPLFPPMEQIWHHREVSVLVREIASNRVVWESRAVNEGPWWDADTVLAAMFQAAMHGFPTPPQGLRRVDLQIGGQKQASPQSQPAQASAQNPPNPRKQP